MHSTQIVAEIRELPSEDGWACFEATGRACVICPCGLNTGFIDKATAAETYRDHALVQQKIRIHIEGGGKAMHDVIRTVVQNS